RLPQPASQSPWLTASSAARRRASTSSEDSIGPGSLILVTVPSGSTRLTLLRTSPRIGTEMWSRSSARSIASRRAPSGPPAGSTARVWWALPCSASETLTPLPLASCQLRSQRSTAPRRRSLTAKVRSTLGLGVTVTITAHHLEAGVASEPVVGGAERQIERPPIKADSRHGGDGHSGDRLMAGTGVICARLGRELLPDPARIAVAGGATRAPSCGTRPPPPPATARRWG